MQFACTGGAHTLATCIAAVQALQSSSAQLHSCCGLQALLRQDATLLTQQGHQEQQTHH